MRSSGCGLVETEVFALHAPGGEPAGRPVSNERPLTRSHQADACNCTRSPQPWAHPGSLPELNDATQEGDGRVNHKRVVRLIRATGTRRSVTVSGAHHRGQTRAKCPDPLKRDFTPPQPQVSR